MSGLGGKFFDLLYPPQCLGCDLWYASDDGYLCTVCEELLLSEQLHRSVNGIDIFSSFRYTSKIIARIVHALKYEHVFGAADLCGKWIAPIFARFPRENTVFVPVPLHKSRMRERGFNQTELICHAAGGVVDTNILFRLTRTKYQALLNEEDRRKNVSGVFVAKRLCDPEVNYVIVDDVVTSGSTIYDCARALRCAGAQKIFGITVASTNSEEAE